MASECVCGFIMHNADEAREHMADHREWAVVQPLTVRRAKRSDGSCNACLCDEYGHVQSDRGKVYHIQMRNMSFRICERHFRELVVQATTVR